MVQIFPGDLLASTFPSPDNPENIRARSELERRAQYVEVMESQYSSRLPAIVQLVKQCLHNVPGLRPSTEELLTRLQEVKTEVEGRYGRDAVKVDLARVRMVKELEMKDGRIEELTEAQVLRRCRYMCTMELQLLFF